jgi:hypothetical protein
MAPNPKSQIQNARIPPNVLRTDGQGDPMTKHGVVS